ncbi:MAG: carbohydrate kinase family protein [Chloroflexi bacterium]|nr:carbohydrate kinase family protein [Chloroflexota bacterium]
MSSPQVVGLGAMNMDYFYRVKSLVKDGEAEVEEFQAFPGGSAANTVYGLARLGVPCGFLGIVGDDEAGRSLVADLDRAGADMRLVKVAAKARTGTVVAIVDREGRRALYVHPGANALVTNSRLSPAGLESASLLHTSAFVGDEQFLWHREALTGLPPQTRLSFSPGALYVRRGFEALAPVLKRTHLMFLNRKELKELTGADLEAGASRCIEEGCQTVVVTLGRGLIRGRRRCCALVATGDNRVWVQAAPGRKQVIDTTGAGDAFAAGFLYGHLKEKPADECGLLGDLMAGLCICKLGARTGLPTGPELNQVYAAITGKDL